MLPKRLKPGDTIGFLAPSNNVSNKEKVLILNASKKLERFGLKVIFSKNFFKKDKFCVSAGEPEERATDLNEMFSDQKISAIYCVQGGETSNQMLRFIDFENIKKNPKIIMGMSDVDVLLLAINKKTGLITFNAPDSKVGRGYDLDHNYSWDLFVKRLFNLSKKIPAFSVRRCIKRGDTEGKIIGCNLISITKLAGTEFFPEFKDAILFIEGQDVNIRRILWELETLRLLGVFNMIKGVVIGHFVNFEEERCRKKYKINVEIEDLFLEVLKDYNFPILKVHEFGHFCSNTILPIGATIRMDAEKKELEIIEDFLI